MLVVEDVVDALYQLLGIGSLQFLSRGNGLLDLGTPGHILAELCEVCALVGLGVHAALQNVAHEIGVCRSICLCVSHQFLKQCDGLGHVLSQTADGNICTL